MKHMRVTNDALQQYIKDVEYLKEEFGEEGARIAIHNAIHQLVIEIKKYKEVDYDIKEMA